MEFSLTIIAEMDLTVLRGGSKGLPTIVCSKETSGWGSDDIELSISVDGSLFKYISNDDIGDFEQDSKADLWQWIPSNLIYQDDVDVKVIELDDIDPDDIGSTQIPAIKDVSHGGKFVIIRSGKNFKDIGVRINVDDGTYTFLCSLETWNESI